MISKSEQDSILESVDSSSNKVKRNPKKSTKKKAAKKDMESESSLMEKSMDMDATLNAEENDSYLTVPRTRRQRNSHRFTIIKGEKPGTDEVEILQSSSDEENLDNMDLSEDVSEKIAMFEEKSFLSSDADFNRSADLSEIIHVDGFTGDIIPHSDNEDKSFLSENRSILDLIKDYESGDITNKDDDENNAKSKEDGEVYSVRPLSEIKSELEPQLESQLESQIKMRENSSKTGFTLSQYSEYKSHVKDKAQDEPSNNTDSIKSESDHDNEILVHIDEPQEEVQEPVTPSKPKPATQKPTQSISDIKDSINKEIQKSVTPSKSKSPILKPSQSINDIKNSIAQEIQKPVTPSKPEFKPTQSISDIKNSINQEIRKPVTPTKRKSQSLKSAQSINDIKNSIAQEIQKPVTPSKPEFKPTQSISDIKNSINQKIQKPVTSSSANLVNKSEFQPINKLKRKYEQISSDDEKPKIKKFNIKHKIESFETTKPQPESKVKEDIQPKKRIYQNQTYLKPEMIPESQSLSKLRRFSKEGVPAQDVSQSKQIYQSQVPVQSVYSKIETTPSKLPSEAYLPYSNTDQKLKPVDYRFQHNYMQKSPSKTLFTISNNNIKVNYDKSPSKRPIRRIRKPLSPSSAGRAKVQMNKPSKSYYTPEKNESKQDMEIVSESGSHSELDTNKTDSESVKKPFTFKSFFFGSKKPSKPPINSEPENNEPESSEPESSELESGEPEKNEPESSEPKPKSKFSLFSFNKNEKPSVQESNENSDSMVDVQPQMEYTPSLEIQSFIESQIKSASASASSQLNILPESKDDNQVDANIKPSTKSGSDEKLQSESKDKIEIESSKSESGSEHESESEHESDVEAESEAESEAEPEAKDKKQSKFTPFIFYGKDRPKHQSESEESKPQSKFKFFTFNPFNFIKKSSTNEPSQSENEAGVLSETEPSNLDIETKPQSKANKSFTFQTAPKNESQLEPKSKPSDNTIHEQSQAKPELKEFSFQSVTKPEDQSKTNDEEIELEKSKTEQEVEGQSPSEEELKSPSQSESRSDIPEQLVPQCRCHGQLRQRKFFKAKDERMKIHTQWNQEIEREKLACQDDSILSFKKEDIISPLFDDDEQDNESNLSHILEELENKKKNKSPNKKKGKDVQTEDRTLFSPEPTAIGKKNKGNAGNTSKTSIKNEDSENSKISKHTTLNDASKISKYNLSDSEIEENESNAKDNAPIRHLLSDPDIYSESDFGKKENAKHFLFKNPTKIFNSQPYEASSSKKRKREEEEDDDDNKLESPKKHRFINFKNPINLQNTVTPVKNVVKNSYNLVKNQLIGNYPTEFYQKFVGGNPTINETLWCSDNSRYKLLMIVGNQNKKVYEVPLTWKSLSSHAAYVLDYGGETFIQFIGSKCTAGERLYSTSICSKLKKRDYIGRGNICHFEEEEAITGQSFILNLFWEALGLANTTPEYKRYRIEKNNKRLEDVIIDERENDTIESLINVYNVNIENKSLDLIHEGSMPNRNILNSKSVIILDAFSEVYLWKGSKSSLDTRNLGVELAKYLYNNHPLFKRPSWAVLEKISESFEPVLFTEKFSDRYIWEDASSPVIYE